MAGLVDELNDFLTQEQQDWGIEEKNPSPQRESYIFGILNGLKIAQDKLIELEDKYHER